ncbi:MAG: ABC transporter permease, partial [Alphaproteobacteria bacterium]|nr:ABC transporter permease [Alphaproteobacteria bacterium]
MADDRFLGLPIRPITRRRIRNFKANRRGYWSFWIFVALLFVSLPAELIANDKPLLARYDGAFYFPVLVSYPESTFGGFLPTTDYTDPFIREEIESKGWIIWPPIPYSYNTFAKDIGGPAPSPPDGLHWLGTDGNSRDVVARLIYGYRISVLFGL